MSELIGADWKLSGQERWFSVVGLTAMLPVVGPLGLTTAGAIVMVDKMNPIYPSTRYGLGGKPFDCYKFRTMPTGTPETPSSGSAGDSRATPLGKKIRKAHFDEILQAVNIYRGDMSLVGPRPLIGQDMDATMAVLSPREQRDWLWARAVARPAPFGPFQLSQHKNQYRAHSESTCYRRAISDIEYARTATFQGDVHILYDSIIDGISSFIFHPESGEEVRGYRGAKLLKSVAEDMGVKIGASETDFWQSAFMLARTVDDLVDAGGKKVAIEPLLAEALSGRPVGSMNAVEAARLAVTYEGLTPGRRQAWLMACLALPEFQQAKGCATSWKQLAHVCGAEATMFAGMLELETTGEDNRARTQFNRWVHTFSQVAYTADNVVDLKKDYRAGAVGVKPNMSNRLLLALDGKQAIARSIETTPFKTYKTLAGIAVRGLFF